jgi:3-isopropylmalate dehydrogenase
VTDNVFGDITMDLAGAVGGGIGMAASANLNPSGSFPSMFEPVHGSAPDIAGTGKADPTAAIMSAALLLEHRGFPELADKIVQAVRQEVASRAQADKPRSTSEIGQAIRALLG